MEGGWASPHDLMLTCGPAPRLAYAVHTLFVLDRDCNVLMRDTILKSIELGRLPPKIIVPCTVTGGMMPTAAYAEKMVTIKINQPSYPCEAPASTVSVVITFET